MEKMKKKLNCEGIQRFAKLSDTDIGKEVG
jgi:hypothetical protein